MENFSAYNPTHVHFGRGVTDRIGEVASGYGKKALLVYGQGSVVKYGYLDKIRANLVGAGIDCVGYGGIRPNPVCEDADRAAEKGKSEHVDLVVAIGGGSVIDSAKIIANCIAGNHPAWDVMSRKARVTKTLPLLVVLTLAATGTEMNAISVLQNNRTRQKIGFSNPLNYPLHSFLDPDFTRSVPRDYTAYGIVDLIAHALEAFFGKGEATLSDRFVCSIIREAMEYGPALLKDLQNYELRARIMWAATNALNGMTIHGRESGDWGVHAIGHTLSFLYDTPHGASLSIAYPAWLGHISQRDPARISQLGDHLFSTTSAGDTIREMKNLFTSLGSPIHLSEIGIGNEKKNEILELMNKNNATGFHYILDGGDRLAILESMM